MGPLLTGMCLVFAIAIVWTLVWPFFKTAPINLKDFIELSISVGGFLVTARARSARSKAKTFRLTPSFNSGLYGGLIGGAVAGLFIGVAYYLQYRSLDESVTLAVIPEIFLFSSIGGLVLGAFITLLILWFRHIAPELFLNEAIGGVIGGAIGGTPVGFFGGWLFGILHEYAVEPLQLLAGTLLGVTFIAAGVLFYDYGGRWQNVRRAFVASLLITVCTATVGSAILEVPAIKALIVFGSDAPFVTQGGPILGAVVGMVAGLQVGLTLSLYRAWEVTDQ